MGFRESRALFFALPSQIKAQIERAMGHKESGTLGEGRLSPDLTAYTSWCGAAKPRRAALPTIWGCGENSRSYFPYFCWRPESLMFGAFGDIRMPTIPVRRQNEEKARSPTP